MTIGEASWPGHRMGAAVAPITRRSTRSLEPRAFLAGKVAVDGIPPENEEMAILTCPDCGVKVQPEDLICFRCGANLPHSPGPDDDVLTPTISQRFIASGSDPGAFCPNCGTSVTDAADVVCATCGTPLPTGRRRRISPVVMRITFPTGNVDIPAGTSVLLGRDPAESLVAAAFARFDNVSRRHATVQVDDAGHA